jgi:hypothetical protein
MVGFYCISSTVHDRGNVYSIIIKYFCRNFMIFFPLCTYFLRDCWHIKNGTLKLHLHLKQRVKCKFFFVARVTFL